MQPCISVIHVQDISYSDGTITLFSLPDRTLVHMLLKICSASDSFPLQQIPFTPVQSCPFGWHRRAGRAALTVLHTLIHSAILAAGQIHWKNTAEQLKLVGPKSLGVALLTAGFVGMVFTIQVSFMHLIQ